MEFSITLQTIKSEWSIVYTEECQVIITPNILFFFLCISNLALANSADPGEMLHNAVFHRDLHCLSNNPNRVVWSTKELHISKLKHRPGLSDVLQLHVNSKGAP